MPESSVTQQMVPLGVEYLEEDCLASAESRLDVHDHVSRTVLYQTKIASF